MTGESPNIPSLLRKARIAFSRENFEEAVGMYAQILQDPEMSDLLDIKTRYAFCIEKTGDFDAAIDVYNQIVEIYKGQGEVGAAKALELKISILQKLAKGELSTEDDAEAIEDFADLSLDTQDMVPLEGASELPEEAEEEKVVAKELITQELADDEVEVVKRPVITQQDLIPVAEKTEPEQQAAPEEDREVIEDHWPAEQGDESLNHLSMMIRKGIHKNVAKRPGDVSGDIELSQLQGFTANNLQLENSEYLEQKKQASAKESEKDKKMQEKAAKIFGNNQRK